MKEYTESEVAALLSAAYLFGLEDGIQMPQASAQDAKETAGLIRAEAADRVLGRVMFMLDADSEASA